VKILQDMAALERGWQRQSMQSLAVRGASTSRKLLPEAFCQRCNELVYGCNAVDS